jgi:hypothetical protein
LAGVIEAVAWLPQSKVVGVREVHAQSLADIAVVTGPVGVGTYAFCDTPRAARTAIAPFGAEVVIDVDAIFVDR